MLVVGCAMCILKSFRDFTRERWRQVTPTNSSDAVYVLEDKINAPKLRYQCIFTFIFDIFDIYDFLCILSSALSSLTHRVAHKPSGYKELFIFFFVRKRLFGLQLYFLLPHSSANPFSGSSRKISSHGCVLLWLPLCFQIKRR